MKQVRRSKNKPVMPAFSEETAVKDDYKEMIVEQVNGSMAIEGMPLTEADKERIRDFAFDATQIDRVVAELVEKHRTSKTKN